MANNHNHDEQHEQQEQKYEHPKENFQLFDEPYVPTTYTRIPESAIVYGRFVYCLGIIVISLFLISNFHEHAILIKRLFILICIVERLAFIFVVPWGKAVNRD